MNKLTLDIIAYLPLEEEEDGPQFRMDSQVRMQMEINDEAIHPDTLHKLVNDYILENTDAEIVEGYELKFEGEYYTAYSRLTLADLDKPYLHELTLRTYINLTEEEFGVEPWDLDDLLPEQLRFYLEYVLEPLYDYELNGQEASGYGHTYNDEYDNWV